MEKDGEKYLGKYEPIISKELFDNVQEVINKKAHVKHQVIPFAFRGILKCAKCGCQLTASKKKGRLTYYYCTNGKGNCGEHKAYLKEEDLSKELSGVFDDLLFDEELIELVYQAKLEEQDKSLSYFDESINSLKGRLKTLEERKNALLDGYLDKTIAQADYEAKNKIINSEAVDIKKSLEELEARKKGQDKDTLERIKNVFLEPKRMKEDFKSFTPDKQRDMLISLLWNAEVANKKIANISFKQPYDVLSKIENKSDFSSVRRGRDSNPRYPFGHDSFQDCSIQPLWHLS